MTDLISALAFHLVLRLFLLAAGLAMEMERACKE